MFVRDTGRPPLLPGDFTFSGEHPLLRSCFEPFIHVCREPAAYTAALAAWPVGLLMRLRVEWAWATALLDWVSELLLMLAVFWALKRCAGSKAALIAASLLATAPVMVWNIAETMHNIVLGGLFLFIALVLLRRSTRDPRPQWPLLAWACGLLAALAFWAYILLTPLFLLPTALLLGRRAVITSLAAVVGGLMSPYLWLYPHEFLHMVTFRANVFNTLFAWTEINPTFAFNSGFAYRFSDTTLLEGVAVLVAIPLMLVGLYRLTRERWWEFALPGIISLAAIAYAYQVPYNYLALRYASLFLLFLSIPTGVGAAWALHASGRHWGVIGSGAVVVLLMGLLAVRLDGLRLRVSLEEASAFDRQFVVELDKLDREHPGPVVILSKGGTAQTEFVGARVNAHSYDLGEVYGQYLRFDRDRGFLQGNVKAIYYSRGTDAVWLESWGTIESDEYTPSGARLVIGKMPVDALYRASLVQSTKNAQP